MSGLGRLSPSDRPGNRCLTGGSYFYQFSESEKYLNESWNFIQDALHRPLAFYNKLYNEN